jgi:hypothetical protein
MKSARCRAGSGNCIPTGQIAGIRQRGGGVRWGGKKWDAASKEYKDLVEIFPDRPLRWASSIPGEANSKRGRDDIIRSVEKAIQRPSLCVVFRCRNAVAIDYLRWIKMATD